MIVIRDGGGDLAPGCRWLTTPEAMAAVGIETPRGSIRANISNCALGIIHFGRMVVFLPEAVLEYETGDAVGRQPLRRPYTFARRKMRVGATGHDNHRSTAGFARRTR